MERSWAEGGDQDLADRQVQGEACSWLARLDEPLTN